MPEKVPLAERYGEVWCKKCRDIVFQEMTGNNGKEIYRCERGHINRLETRSEMDKLGVPPEPVDDLPTREEIQRLRNSDDHWSNTNGSSY